MSPTRQAWQRISIGMAAIAADYDNDGNRRSLRGRIRQGDSLPQQGQRHIHEVTAKAGINVDRLVDQFGMAGLRPRRLRRSLRRALREIRPEVSRILSRRQLSWPARLRWQHQPPLSQQLQRNIHRRNRQVRDWRIQGPNHGRHRSRLRQRRLAGHLRLQRQDRELPLSQQARWYVRRDRGRLGVAYGQNGEIDLRDGTDVRRHRR